jgi:hypothetical protein
MTYHEVAPQLVLMAFLQKVLNGGGVIDREYGLGRRRIDLPKKRREAGALRLTRAKAPSGRRATLLRA